MRYVFSEAPNLQGNKWSRDYTKPVSMSPAQPGVYYDTSYYLPEGAEVKYERYIRKDLFVQGQIKLNTPVTRIEHWRAPTYGEPVRTVNYEDFPPTGGLHGSRDHSGRFYPDNLPELVLQGQRELGWTVSEEVRELLHLP